MEEPIIKRTKNGKYAKRTKNWAAYGFDGYFTKYYTKEELEEEKRLYKEKAKYPEIDLKYLINVECELKSNFSLGLWRVLKFIEPNYTNLWVEKQSEVSRVVIQRILDGMYTPNLQNFYRLLYFIERHIDNFNVWSLIDSDAPIQRTSDYTPFAKYKGKIWDYEFQRNVKYFHHDVLDLPVVGTDDFDDYY